eukprot:scaffold82841_cov63-Cyclotella_meneghiniana.AAC.9
MNMRAINGRESTLSNWLDNESEKFREMRVLAGPTLKTVIQKPQRSQKPSSCSRIRNQQSATPAQYDSGRRFVVSFLFIP